MTAEAQAAVLQDGLAQLETRRQRWRDHAEELHAIVRETSPLIVQWAAEGPGAPVRT